MKPGCRRVGCLVLVNGAAILALLLAFLLFYPLAENFTALRADAFDLDDSLVPRFRPNLRDEPYLHTKASFDPQYDVLKISTNSAGFRDRERTLQKPADTWRVAFVGDSFVFGLDLTDAQTLPRQIEDELQRRGGLGGRAVEVLNFGLPGLNFEGMGRVTQIVVAAYHPDVVLYSFISDDISRTDVIALREWMLPLEPTLRRLPSWLADVVRDDLLVRYKMVRYDLDFRVLSAIPSWYRERIGVVADYLTGLARDGGWKLGIVDFSRFPLAREGFERYLEAHTVDGVQPFRLLTGFDLEVNPRNAHPTAASQARLAPLVADLLTGMLTGAPTAPPTGGPTPPP